MSAWTVDKNSRTVYTFLDIDRTGRITVSNTEPCPTCAGRVGYVKVGETFIRDCEREECAR